MGGRMFGSCVNCQEDRELVAHHLCVNCYRRKEREDKRDPDYAGQQAERHSRQLAQSQNTYRKACTSIVAACDKAAGFFTSEDISAIRQIVNPYWVRLAPEGAGVSVHSEEESEHSLGETSEHSLSEHSLNEESEHSPEPAPQGSPEPKPPLYIKDGTESERSPEETSEHSLSEHSLSKVSEGSPKPKPKPKVPKRKVNKKAR